MLQTVDRLEKILAQIIAFDRLFLLKRLDAYRWNLWGVAHLICGYCSDDSFDDFRHWLISQGRQAFERVLQNPEAVIDLLESQGQMALIKANPAACVQCESLPYASYDAYKALAGEDMPSLDIDSIIDIFPRKPAGKCWNEDDLPTTFPSIAKMFCHLITNKTGDDA